MAFGALLGTAGASGATSSFSINQLAGPNRFATAAAIAAGTFPHGAATVVVTSGVATDLADSLAASYLAAHENGGTGAPILLTSTDSVPAATAAELRSLGATKVVVVGGSAAVGPQVLSTLVADHLSVSRVAGPNRFATADAVDSQAGMTTVGSAGGRRWAIVASGSDSNLADALGASPLSYARDFPLLLVNGPTGRLTSSDLAVIRAGGVNDVLTVGGTASVGTQVSAQLTAAGYVPVNVAGPNRSSTSEALADYAIAHFGFSATHFDVASGDQAHLVDSLAGGPCGGSEHAPTLITDSVANPGSAATFAAAHAPTEASAHLFGGSAAVDPTAASTIAVAAATGTA